MYGSTEWHSSSSLEAELIFNAKKITRIFFNQQGLRKYAVDKVNVSKKSIYFQKQSGRI